MSNTPIGREYQHLEDLLIINGSAGGVLALAELQDAISNPQTMDFKWDGGSAVFWGRNADGVFVFVPKNQWSKSQFMSRDELVQEIRKTGRPKFGQDPRDFAEYRKLMSNKYQNLWDIFERATPKDFRGFLNGDLMFTEQHTLSDTYSFTPNKVTYKVSGNGLYGKLASAHVFVVVHGKINIFGAAASGNLVPESDVVIQEFNKNADIIVLNTQHPSALPCDIDFKLNEIETSIIDNASEIDQLVNFNVPKFTTIKQVLYNFSVATAKNPTDDFQQWLNSCKLSKNHKSILQELSTTNAWNIFWQTYDKIADAKHKLIYQIFTSNSNSLYHKWGITSMVGGEIGGEGLVKQCNNGQLIKLVNPAFRSAPANIKFTTES